MDDSWNNARQLAQFQALWERRPCVTKRHTRESWDLRAQSWENGLRSNEAKRQRSEQRVAATAEFLRAHGLLGPDCEAIDIGCGPGRFVAEFARTAKHVVGTDLSPQMLEYAQAFSREQGLENTSFVPCDFKQADLDELGWRGRFDLVFTSITPAVSGSAGLEKAIAMSRGWCFNASFLTWRDEFLELVSQEVFGRKAPQRWDGRSSYALFNLLWLRGWHPYVSYYAERSMDRYTPDHTLALTLAENLGIDPDDRASVEKIYRFVMEKAGQDGQLCYGFECRYIWLLWNVNDRMERASYELPPAKAGQRT